MQQDAREELKKVGYYARYNTVSGKIIIVLMDHGNHERQQRENINFARSSAARDSSGLKLSGRSLTSDLQVKI